ncbi:hypothetical protein FA13DRAFT_1612737, partial [Coprinellus micaceus]
AIVPSQAGFNRMFAAWVFDEGLTWTTGQAPMLQNLFHYVKVKYGLPTDTTIRNQLAKIFIELFEEVIKEFSVRDYRQRIQDMVYTFAATIASFVDDEWNLIERVVDFKPLEDKEHEG